MAFAARVLITRPMFVWSKLSASKWLDAWEDRFHGNPNFVLHVIKGGKSVKFEDFVKGGAAK